jgi:hypothetical protein
MVVQCWSQYMGEKRNWGPCVVDEAGQAVHDATAVEVDVPDIAAAAEAAAVMVAVGTAALALLVVGKWGEEVQVSGSWKEWEEVGIELYQQRVRHS